jgi:hypothetical protein
MAVEPASVMSWTGLKSKTPALFTSTIGAPNAFFVASKSSFTSAAFDMSARTATALPPLPVISATTRSAPSLSEA